MSSGRLVDTIPPAVRKRPLEVMAFGFSRTALKVALEKLDYKVYHMSECCMRWEDKHLLLWDEAIKAKCLGKGKPWTGDDLDKILQNYTAIEDIPCIMFVDELLEKFPDARIILTTRDIDSWEHSVRQTIFKIVAWKNDFLETSDTNYWGPYLRILRNIVSDWTQGDITNREAFRNRYQNHYNHVREKVPKERLLEFHPRDGWKPLCEFLDKPMPEEGAFPKVNDTRWLIRLHWLLYYWRLLENTKQYIVTGLILLVGVGLYYWRVM